MNPIARIVRDYLAKMEQWADLPVQASTRRERIILATECDTLRDMMTDEEYVRAIELRYPD